MRHVAPRNRPKRPRRHGLRRRTRLHSAAAALLTVAALTLSACGTGAPADGGADDGIDIVASTDVYGAVAAQIAGPDASVTSIISGAAQDPHSYQASAQDTLAISKAELVIANGGGYDPFMTQIIDDRGLDPKTVISAVEVADLSDSNEHVWYSLAGMRRVATAVTEKLATIDPGHADAYERRAAELTDTLKSLSARVDAIRHEHGGEAVAVTEPVPHYLLKDAGLVNKTPAAFTEAVEEGTDVPVMVLLETEKLLSSHAVALLAYNEQTQGAQTQKIREAAREASVPVVNFTETLPKGQNYRQWMRANMEHLAAALGK